MAPTPRESWSDQRLDELGKKVEDGFDGVGKRMDRVERRMDRVESKVDALGEKVSDIDKKVGKLETKVDGLEKKVDVGLTCLKQDSRDLRSELIARLDKQDRAMWGIAIAIIIALVGTGIFF